MNTAPVQQNVESTMIYLLVPAATFMPTYLNTGINSSRIL